MNTKASFRFGFFFIWLLVAGLAAAAVLIPIASAGTITVNTLDDEVNGDGDCSLREAVIAANSDAAVDGCAAGQGDDIITVPPGTYLLTLGGAEENEAQTGDLDLTANVTINGGGQGVTIVDGNGADRIFHVHDGAEVTISGVTVQNGSASSGGGINVVGALTLSASRVTANTTTGVGGGIFAGGMVTVTNSRIDANTATGGGGLFVSFLQTVVTNSEISGNNVSGGGGGVYSSGTLALVNSTLSGNTAGGSGGGLFVVESPNVHLYNITISNNTADSDGDDNGDGGGVASFGGTSTTNTLISGNFDNSSPGMQHDDCTGVLFSDGYNLVTDITGCIINGDPSGNLLGADPVLGPLQNNGGSTLTHALLEGSQAIDAGNPGGCRDHNGNLLGTDQRGFERPSAGSNLCDIGAYEAGSDQPPTPTATTTFATPTATPEWDHWQYLPLIPNQGGAAR